jgi:predicted phage-related endonuclease
MTETATSDAVELDGLSSWLQMYRDLGDRIASLEEQRKEARTRIEAALGDAETGTIGGRPAVRWSHVTSTRLDQRVAKALLNDRGLLEAAMVETTSRRFVLVDEDEG